MLCIVVCCKRKSLPCLQCAFLFVLTCVCVCVRMCPPFLFFNWPDLLHACLLLFK